MFKIPVFLVYLEGIEMRLSAMCRIVQNSESWFSFICEGAVTGPWILEMDEVRIFLSKISGFHWLTGWLDFWL